MLKVATNYAYLFPPTWERGRERELPARILTIDFDGPGLRQYIQLKQSENDHIAYAHHLYRMLNIKHSALEIIKSLNNLKWITFG